MARESNSSLLKRHTHMLDVVLPFMEAIYIYKSVGSFFCLKGHLIPDTANIAVLYNCGRV